MPDSNLCEICRKQQRKYKCPACLIRYCSLQCFKEHKDQLCSERTLPTVVTEEETKIAEQVALEDGEISGSEDEGTEDRVSREKLEALAYSEELVTLLRNPHLRTLISSVDSAQDVPKAIHDAMMEPIFTEFADACLHVVEPDKYDAEL